LRSKNDQQLKNLVNKIIILTYLDFGMICLSSTELSRKCQLQLKKESEKAVILSLADARSAQHSS
jgi:hypothetical protein